MTQYLISAEFIISEKEFDNEKDSDNEKEFDNEKDSDNEKVSSKLTDLELNVFKLYLLNIWEYFNCVKIDFKIIDFNFDSISIQSIILTDETISNIQIYLEVLNEKSIYQADLHNNYYFSNITKIDIKKIMQL